MKARSEKEIFGFLAADFALWLGVVNFFRAFLSIAFVAMQHAIVQTGYGLLCRAQEHLAWNTWIPRRDDIQGISYTILRVFDGFDWHTMITWPDIFKATMALLRVSENQLLNSVDAPAQNAAGDCQPSMTCDFFFRMSNAALTALAQFRHDPDDNLQRYKLWMHFPEVWALRLPATGK